jgi:hypothetical protein
MRLAGHQLTCSEAIFVRLSVPLNPLLVVKRSLAVVEVFSHKESYRSKKYWAITFSERLPYSFNKTGNPLPVRVEPLSSQLRNHASSILQFFDFSPLHIFIFLKSPFQRRASMPSHINTTPHPPPRTFHLFSPLYHPSSPSPALFTVLPLLTISLS